MNPEFDRRVGQNIRALRKQKRWSQEQLAAKLQVLGCDMTRSALAKIEAGQRHIYADEIFLLRTIFCCEYAALFHENEKQPRI